MALNELGELLKVQCSIVPTIITIHSCKVKPFSSHKQHGICVSGVLLTCRVHWEEFIAETNALVLATLTLIRLPRDMLYGTDLVRAANHLLMGNNGTTLSVDISSLVLHSPLP